MGVLDITQTAAGGEALVLRMFMTLYITITASSTSLHQLSLTKICLDVEHRSQNAYITCRYLSGHLTEFRKGK